jgi:hypothetical protein
MFVVVSNIFIYFWLGGAGEGRRFSVWYAWWYTWLVHFLGLMVHQHESRAWFFGVLWLRSRWHPSYLFLLLKCKIAQAKYTWSMQERHLTRKEKKKKKKKKNSLRIVIWRHSKAVVQWYGVLREKAFSSTTTLSQSSKLQLFLFH